MMNKSQTQKLTAAALITAAALVVFVIEAQIPPLTPVPGIKLGLANIFTLFAMFTLGPGYAAAILTARVLLGALITGQVSALLYSFVGGILSMTVGIILFRAVKLDNVWALSALSAVLHNLGQLTAAILITRTPELIAYLPLLIISGVITGAFTGVCAQLVIRRLTSLKLVDFKGRQ